MAGGPTKGWRMRDGRARARRRKPAPIGPPALGAGLITGAADDDPSGIATYSQAGAQFGYAMLWTMPLTLPLMVAIQLVSARIGCVTRRGLAANIKRDFPPIVLWAVVGLLLTANTLNLAADIAAMAQAVHLVAGGPVGLYAAGFGALSLTLQVYMRYQAYVRWLKWLTLALLAYVAVAFTVEVDWPALIRETALPGLALGHDALLMIVAVFGTTISPYLFFWQAALEMESGHDGRPRSGAGLRAQRRIRADTLVGMTFSNLIGFSSFSPPPPRCTRTAARLSRRPRKPPRRCGRWPGTSASRCSAWASWAPACWPCRCWRVGRLCRGRGRRLAGQPGRPSGQGRGRGLLRDHRRGHHGRSGAVLHPLDPVAELFWAAVCNGVIALPIMSVMMLLASRPKVMGAHVIGPCLRLAGWSATGVMALVVVAMLATL